MQPNAYRHYRLSTECDEQKLRIGGKIEIVASATPTRGTTFALAEANFSTGGAGRKLP